MRVAGLSAAEMMRWATERKARNRQFVRCECRMTYIVDVPVQWKPLENLPVTTELQFEIFRCACGARIPIAKGSDIVECAFEWARN